MNPGVRTPAIAALPAAFASFLLAAAPLQAKPPSASDADLNGDGIVDGADVGLLLLQWQGPGSADFDQNGIVNGGDLGQLLLHWAALIPPTIDQADPASTLVVGGGVITIIGESLASAFSVTFGGLEALEIVSADATSVTVKAPPHPYGSADVVVSTLGGTATAAELVFFDHLPVEWATVLEVFPDPAIVTLETTRQAIVATGYPWKIRHPASAIEMVLIPPSMFVMGATPDTVCTPSWYDLPQHPVTLTQPFYLAQTEVTIGQWFTGNVPQTPGCGLSTSDPNRPVTCVTIHNVLAWLGVRGLRLPTEAEWEYACRAGTTTDLYGPASDIAATGSGTVAVATRTPNHFGLYDMIGNAAEWVADTFAAYSQEPQVDPLLNGDQSWRIRRGGSFDGVCLSASRRTLTSSCCDHTQHPAFGFRAARTP